MNEEFDVLAEASQTVITARTSADRCRYEVVSVIRGIGRFAIKPGKAKEFAELCAAAVQHARNEDGIEEYSFYISGNDCVTFEAYRDSAALAAHVAGPVGTEIFPRAVELADLTGAEYFGDLDETAAGIAKEFEAKVYPGPAHAL